MIESTVIRMICGVSALKTVFSMENTSAIKINAHSHVESGELARCAFGLLPVFHFSSHSAPLFHGTRFLLDSLFLFQRKSIPEAIRDALKPRFL